jgi:flagellar hook-basal body complex protein FliE
MAINQVLAQMRTMAAAAGSDVRPGVESAQSGQFTELLSKSIDDVKESMHESKMLTQRFEAGDPNVSLAEVMVTAQKASLQFAGLTEVRNKVLNAYQEVMNMSV